MEASEEPSPIPGLPASVAKRLVTELGGADGRRVLRCLQTADLMLRLADRESADLRLAESAAYNLREALDSVVRDRPAGEGGFSAAVKTWDDYRLAISLPGADEAAALAELKSEMDRLVGDKEHQAYMTRKLLDWFQEQTGVAPIAGAEDPTRQYGDLRERAARILHGDASYGEVDALTSEVLSWFIRLFTPPSDLMSKIEQLASLPYSPEHLRTFQSLALTEHHLRLFLERLTDPDWLDPLKATGFITLPTPGRSWWPVSALAGTARRLPDARVAGLLMGLLAEVKSLPKADRPACAFEILRTASWLGPAGLPVVLEVLRQYPSDRWTQTLAISDTQDLDPSDAVHVEIADRVIGNEGRYDRSGHTRTMVDRITSGLAPDNVGSRVHLLVNKLRRLANDDQARFVVIDIAALSVPDDDDDLAEPLIIVAQGLAESIPATRTLGFPANELLEGVRTIPGEIGERMVCQALAGTTEIDRSTKLDHLVQRLASSTATGDDQALVDDLSPFSDNEVEHLRTAFGSPGQRDPDRPDVPFGENWPRGWRWAMVLPEPVLAGWGDAIAAVSAVHGAPDASALTRRLPRMTGGTGSSPISSEELGGLEVAEAATIVASWRPSSDDPWGVSARELARSLESTVSQHPERWTEDPAAVVRLLREPVYVDHYFRGLKAGARAISMRASSVIEAIAVAREERWEPTILGRDSYEYEADWSVVETVSVELIDALADADADLAGDLAFCWDVAIAATMAIPDDDGTVERFDDAERFDDPLHEAINSTHGRGLQAVIALGGWEHRNQGSASNRLGELLTWVLEQDEAAGAQLRAIVAGSRPFVEGIAPSWFAANQERLFGDALGTLTFDQTLKYSRPTRTFFDRSLNQLLDAARRRAEHAVSWLLIAYLWDEPGYTFEAIINGLKGDALALAEACGEVARLSTGLPPEQISTAERGVVFWERILAEPKARVPVSSLRSLGRWALATDLQTARWLGLTESTVQVTGGELENASEVATRCRDAQPSPAGLRILTSLLGHGEPWEQRHVESIAVEAVLSAEASGLVDDAVDRLRERLIRRGRHDVGPPDPTDGG